LLNRVSYALVVMLLLVAAGLRLWDLSGAPAGLNAAEITDARIIETARQGRIEVFYNLQGVGREGLYGTTVAALTSLTGSGVLGYRIHSVFTGMLTLALMYALAKRLFGAPAGVAAMGLLAVGMYPVVLSRSVGPDQVVPLLVTAILLALAYALPLGTRAAQGEPNTTPFATLGVLLGISFYVHPAAFLITLVAMFFIVYMVLTRQSMQPRTFSYIWFSLVVLIVIATPYLIASLQQIRLAGANRLFDSGTYDPIQSVIAGFGALMFIGDLNPASNLPGRPLVDLISGFLILIGVLAIFRFWRRPRFFLVLLPLILLAPPALLSANAPDFTHFAALLPVFALCFGLGVTVLYRSLHQKARRIVMVGIVALLIFNLQWTIRDLFVNWASLPETQIAYNARIGSLANYLDRTASDTDTVICTQQITPIPAPVQLNATQLLALMMARSDVLLRYADCGLALILTQGGGREQVVLLDETGREGVHPYFERWLGQGEVVSEPGLPPNSVITLEVTESLADAIGAFTTTAPVAYAPEVAGSDAVAAPPIRFGGNIAFLGDERTWSGVYRPGDLFQLITYWRVDGIVPGDLRFFTHILPDPAAIAAQNDTIGVLPAQLQPRDVIIQVINVQLPYTMPRGAYSVSIGAYEGNTNTRLNVFDGDTARGNRLFLGGLTVE
jgi:4-amino-4-deoxy-L-arabinose transferase-like glycosyltransferase